MSNFAYSSPHEKQRTAALLRCYDIDIDCSANEFLNTRATPTNNDSRNDLRNSRRDANEATNLQSDEYFNARGTRTGMGMYQRMYGAPKSSSPALSCERAESSPAERPYDEALINAKPSESPTNFQLFKASAPSSASFSFSKATQLNANTFKGEALPPPPPTSAPPDAGAAVSWLGKSVTSSPLNEQLPPSGRLFSLNRRAISSPNRIEKKASDKARDNNNNYSQYDDAYSALPVKKNFYSTANMRSSDDGGDNNKMRYIDDEAHLNDDNFIVDDDRAYFKNASDVYGKSFELPKIDTTRPEVDVKKANFNALRSAALPPAKAAPDLTQGKRPTLAVHRATERAAQSRPITSASKIRMLEPILPKSAELFSSKRSGCSACVDAKAPSYELGIDRVKFSKTTSYNAAVAAEPLLSVKQQQTSNSGGRVASAPLGASNNRERLEMSTPSIVPTLQSLPKLESTNNLFSNKKFESVVSRDFERHKENVAKSHEKSYENYNDSCAAQIEEAAFRRSAEMTSRFSSDSMGYDDTGIDSAHSTTSSVDYKDALMKAEVGESATRKKNSSSMTSSYYSSMDSLQIDRSPTISSIGQQSPPPSIWSPTTMPTPANVLAQSHSVLAHISHDSPMRSLCGFESAEKTKFCFETNANVMRRKLSAHSKMKSKRTSTLISSDGPDENNNDNNKNNKTNNANDRALQSKPSGNEFDALTTTVRDERKKCCDDSDSCATDACADSSQEDGTSTEAMSDDTNRSSLVVRQQPALRVKAIIDKLLYMSGRDQRRALFSLKSIFQNDKDVVHEFVRNGGLECLVRIGRASDQNHQNHILRAIGQLMLYVDGMNGIIASSDTVCWIYQLLDSPYRLVVKTALKLLLVFVEYTESNSLLLLAAVSNVEKANGRPEWYSLMRILNERQASDEETLIFGMTVINKTLHGVPDQDTFFDIVDVLEGQGLEDALEAMLKLNNAQLAQQCAHYEHELRKEDAALESDNGNNNNNNSGILNKHVNNYNNNNDIMKLRVNGSLYSQQNGNDFNSNNASNSIANTMDRRNDRLRRQKLQQEHLGMDTVTRMNGLFNNNNNSYSNANNNQRSVAADFGQHNAAKQQQQNGYIYNSDDIAAATPTTSAAATIAGAPSTTMPTTTMMTALEQRKAPWRAAEQQQEQQNGSYGSVVEENGYENNNNSELASRLSKDLRLNNNNNTLNNNNNKVNGLGRVKPPEKILIYDEPLADDGEINHADGKENIKLNGDLAAAADDEERRSVKAPPPSIPVHIFSPTEKKTMEFPDMTATTAPPPPPPLPPAFANRSTVEESKPKAAADSDEEATVGCGGGFAAMLQKRAKKMENSAFRRGIVDTMSRQSDSEVKWKEAAEKLKEKPMIINDLDFSGFIEFEQDPLVLVKTAQVAQDRQNYASISGAAPPAPPPIPNGARSAPPPPPPASFGSSGQRKHTSAAGGASSRSDGNGGGATSSAAAMSGTLKLHWKPAQADAPPVPALKKKGTFWNQMETTPQIDISKLSRLFEQKPKEAPIKKGGAEAKPQILQILSVKRSQAINIGLTKLPPITVIPAAIRKFDASVLNKEGIEKILSTMMPSSEEVERIREAQADNPATPLGQAEQFMLNLSEIDCLLERLRLWLFMLDYHNLEKDVAEALMELNNAMKEIEESKTFRVAMGMLLSIGNALNGTDIKAFQLDYLSRASEVKDPVHKYPLTHHLAEYMLDNYPAGTDLYSELGAVSRSSRLDFDAVLDNLKKMETDCKACFDYVAKISQRDNNSSMKNKVNAFLAEVAERIHRLKHVHRTTIHRWNAFLLYFGYAPSDVKEQKPISVFKMVIEFALEYRTNRDKILQMRKRMAEKRERNKTRGMMIGVAQASAGAQNQIGGGGSGTCAQRALGSAPNSAGNANVEALMTDRERHQEMSRLLTNSERDASSATLGRRRAGQPTPERALIAAQTEALRKNTAALDGAGGISNTMGATTASGIDYADDELLDGVVRTVTAQADTRDHNRRRARLFNRKSLRRTRTIRHDQLTELSQINTYS